MLSLYSVDPPDPIDLEDSDLVSLEESMPDEEYVLLCQARESDLADAAEIDAELYGRLTDLGLETVRREGA